jgi:hypothetical protein
MLLCHSLVLAATLAVLGPAHASGKACLPEGSFAMMGQKALIKDCMPDSGLPQVQIVEGCKGLSGFTVQFGDQLAPITDLAACPTGAWGVCENLFGVSMSGHCHPQKAAAFKDTVASCQSGAGTWRKG